MNTSNNNLKEFLIDKLIELKKWFFKHIKIVLPIIVGIIGLLVIIIALSAHNKKVKAEEEALAESQVVQSQMEEGSVAIAIPEVPLEKDANSAVNEVIKKYYDARANGDTDIMKQINSFLDDTELIRIAETAQYIDEYTTLDIYTKPGPVENTYCTYVYYELKFKDYDILMPGMKAYYLCTDANGNLYMNEGEESDSVINYIREVSLQDDVVDLNNRVVATYNDLVAADAETATFLLDLTNSIDTSVGEMLAQNEGSTTIEDEPEEEEENNPSTTTEVVTTVKTTTTVNVRSSDSETADKVGKASEGQELKLIEARGNGWSEVEFNGQSAFIKSEFLEAAGTETIVTVAEEETADAGNTTTTTTATNTDSSSTTVSGTVTVKDNVRIRAAASENAEKLGTAYMGQKLDLIMKQSDGWTKIKYNGKVAYVKSEYVE